MDAVASVGRALGTCPGNVPALSRRAPPRVSGYASSRLRLFYACLGWLWRLHADEEVQVLRAVVVQVLAVVEEELVERAHGEGQHQLRRDGGGGEAAEREDVRERSLDENVKVVARVGQEGLQPKGGREGVPCQ